MAHEWPTSNVIRTQLPIVRATSSLPTAVLLQEIGLVPGVGRRNTDEADHIYLNRPLAWSKLARRYSDGGQCKPLLSAVTAPATAAAAGDGRKSREALFGARMDASADGKASVDKELAVRAASPLAQPPVKRLNRTGKRLWKGMKTMNERYGLKHLVLAVVLVAYAFLGAIMFQYLESPWEQQRLAWHASHAAERRQELLTAIERIVVANCTQGFVGVCNGSFQQLVGDYERALGVDEPHHKYRWDLWNSLFFAATVFTTIGYGHMTCKTFWGRLATMCYAMAGIPLMLTFLNGLGNAMFRRARRMWNRMRRQCRNVLRRATTDEQTALTRTLSYLSNATMTTTNLNEPYENFPLPLAVIAVFLYILICAALFCTWESRWDYSTAVYFFFVSLTTIGFGDVLPDHPRFTILSFTLFIIGLALVSMCINVMQAKVEKRYKSYFDFDSETVGGGDGTTATNPSVSMVINGLADGLGGGQRSKLQTVTEITSENSIVDHSEERENRASLGVFQITRRPQSGRQSQLSTSSTLLRSSALEDRFVSTVQQPAVTVDQISRSTLDEGSLSKYPSAFLYEQSGRRSVIWRDAMGVCVRRPGRQRLSWNVNSPTTVDIPYMSTFSAHMPLRVSFSPEVEDGSK